MKKIESWVRSFLAFGARHKLTMILGLSLLLIILSIFYGMVYGKLWLKLPESIKAQVAINRLGLSSYNNPVCHETCFYERQLYKQIIAENLAVDKVNLKVKNLILAEDNNLDFRLELLDVFSLRRDLKIPDYLEEYLTSGSEPKVKDKIKEFFVTDPVSVDELLLRFDTASSSADRVEILRLLQEKSDSALADFYWDLISTNPDLKIKSGALSALSNLLPSESYVTVDFLSKIKKTILAADTNRYLRKEVVMLLGSYLPVQEKTVTEILEELYNNQSAVDKFSRLFVVDILNRSSASSYTKPEISASEWQEYRDHNSLWGNE